MRGVLAIFRHSRDFLDSMMMDLKNNIIIQAKHTNMSGQFPTPMFFFPMFVDTCDIHFWHVMPNLVLAPLHSTNN